MKWGPIHPQDKFKNGFQIYEPPENISLSSKSVHKLILMKAAVNNRWENSEIHNPKSKKSIEYPINLWTLHTE